MDNYWVALVSGHLGWVWESVEWNGEERIELLCDGSGDGIGTGEGVERNL